MASPRAAFLLFRSSRGFLCRLDLRHRLYVWFRHGDAQIVQIRLKAQIDAPRGVERRADLSEAVVLRRGNAFGFKTL